jgi:tRNA A-37 threonylcarbamoyl transferase component Bud32
MSIGADIIAGKYPVHLLPFAGLASSSESNSGDSDNSGLLEKLVKDPLLPTYSIYGFFPTIHEIVYHSDRPPEIAFDGRARGRVAIIKAEDTAIVVKPLQSSREGEIAGIAGELGVGPAQYPSLPGFITEEFVAGRFFTGLPADEITPESMYLRGRDLGNMLAALHSRRIYYNDATLSDPSGRSHLIVGAGGDCRLIDFGVSLLLDGHQPPSREDVYNFVRTLPMFRMLSGMGITGSDLDHFLDEYRPRLAHASSEEIMARDLQFTEQGLAMAAQYLGGGIVALFRRGLEETYR